MTISSFHLFRPQTSKSSLTPLSQTPHIPSVGKSCWLYLQNIRRIQRFVMGSLLSPLLPQVYSRAVRVSLKSDHVIRLLRILQWPLHFTRCESQKFYNGLWNPTWSAISLPFSYFSNHIYFSLPCLFTSNYVDLLVASQIPRYAPALQPWLFPVLGTLFPQIATWLTPLSPTNFCWNPLNEARPDNLFHIATSPCFSFTNTYIIDLFIMLID